MDPDSRDRHTGSTGRTGPRLRHSARKRPNDMQSTSMPAKRPVVTITRAGPCRDNPAGAIARDRADLSPQNLWKTLGATLGKAY